MQKIKYSPLVFEIIDENDPTGSTVYELLTLEQQSPRDTVYFMKKGAALSDRATDFIVKAIENEEWEQPFRLEHTRYTLKNFDIDPAIFDAEGEEYADIRKLLYKKITNA